MHDNIIHTHWHFDVTEVGYGQCRVNIANYPSSQLAKSKGHDYGYIWFIGFFEESIILNIKESGSLIITIMQNLILNPNIQEAVLLSESVLSKYKLSAWNCSKINWIPSSVAQFVQILCSMRWNMTPIKWLKTHIVLLRRA